MWSLDDKVAELPHERRERVQSRYQELKREVARPAGRAQIPRMAPPRDIDELRSALRAMLPDLKSRWPLSYLGVFGSWVRREQRA